MNAQILETANRVVKNSNFTQIVKARKNAPLHLPFFVGSDFTLWLSYSNDNTYLTIANQTYLLR